MAKPKGIGLATPTAGPSKAHMDHYQARDDMDTLRRAEEIRMDRPRHSAAKKMASVHVKALQRIRAK